MIENAIRLTDFNHVMDVGVVAMNTVNTTEQPINPPPSSKQQQKEKAILHQQNANTL